MCTPVERSVFSTRAAAPVSARATPSVISMTSDWGGVPWRCKVLSTASTKPGLLISIGDTLTLIRSRRSSGR
jgi:hypothetical protein